MTPYVLVFNVITDCLNIADISTLTKESSLITARETQLIQSAAIT